MDTSKQKPDLMGKSGASPDGVKRILAHLEHGAKLPASKPAGWSIDGWTLGLATMLLGICCIAWLMHDGGNQTSGFKRSYGGGATRYEATQASTAVERMPTALARADMPALTSGSAPEQPAAIINDAAAQADPGLEARMRAARDAGLTNAFGLPAFKADAAALARHAATAATADGVPLSARHSNRSDAASASAANPGGNSPAAASAGAASASAKNHVGAGTGRASATAHTSARGKAPSANDTDVALLTALVAHAGKPAVIAPERSRDIVERHDGDSTADLLARCKQLGVIEGMLCRSRICSGRWDSDPVCHAPTQ